MSVIGRASRRAERVRPRYSRFLKHVEPELLSRPRVHRFAATPVFGPPDEPSRPLGVCVEPGSDAEATRDALESQTAPAATVIESPLGDAVGSSRADWIVRVAAGDRPASVALERLGQAISLAPDAAIVTADDDLAPPGSRRSSPRLRPGPSPDLWAARDPGFGLVALRREDAAAAWAQGSRSNHEMLRALGGPDGAGHAHVPLVLCHRAAPAERGSPPASPRPPAAEPAVEAIVCFRDRPALLERAVRSLLKRSAYERLGLRLVDNDSEHPRTAEVTGVLARDARVTLDSDSRPFNFSALNNAAAARSAADVLVFLNSDTEIIQPDWIETLLPHALRPEVGAVAPLLLYPDGRVQHAGAAIGLHGWAGHPFAGLHPDTETPFGRACDGPRNWMAVSAACLMVERRKFSEVGGFDEAFAVGGGDVDLGLRLTRAGYRSLCVPAARVIHDESATRDPAAIPPGDFEASRRSYGEFRTVGDPFYHPALTLEDTSCRVRTR